MSLLLRTMTVMIFIMSEKVSKVRTRRMKTAILYIHGKGGNAAESEHYKPLFPECDVLGLDYKTFTPWETGKEIHSAIKRLNAEYEHIIYLGTQIEIADVGICYGVVADTTFILICSYGSDGSNPEIVLFKRR